MWDVNHVIIGRVSPPPAAALGRSLIVFALLPRKWSSVWAGAVAVATDGPKSGYAAAAETTGCRGREREAHFEQVNIIPEGGMEGESRCIEGWLLGLQ